MSCRSNQKVLCGRKECEVCVPRSFYSFEDKKKVEAWSDKNEKKSWEVRKGSDKKYWFNCYDCFHEINVSLDKIRAGKWCRYCSGSGSNFTLCDKTECMFCYNNSFASHEKSKYWNLDKNKIDPRKIRKRSAVKYWFNCYNCKHEIFVAPDKIHEGSWCTYCNGKGEIKLCDNIDCKWCFDRSFASHEKCRYWDFDKNIVQPRNVRLNSNSNFWFICDVCSHNVNMGLNNIVAGKWCVYCRRGKLCNNLECNWCLKYSFASHEKSIYWNYEKNNGITPRQVRLHTGKKYYFTCPYCKEEYHSSIDNISSGSWCSCLKNKTEAKLFYFLQNFRDTLQRQYPSFLIKNIKLKKQKKFKWCKKQKRLPFDFYLRFEVTYCTISNDNFYIKTLVIKILIELDGNQHFVQVSNWTSPEETQENDRYKEEKAFEKGINMIRIYQPSVFEDREEWNIKLTESIIFLVSNKEKGSKITIGEIYKQN